jgi:hypothetical protein
MLPEENGNSLRMRINNSVIIFEAYILEILLLISMCREYEIAPRGMVNNFKTLIFLNAKYML